MKKRVYRVQTLYVFEGVVEVVAESEEEARRKVIQDCEFMMGRSIQLIFPDRDFNWDFSTPPEVKTGWIIVQDKPSE